MNTPKDEIAREIRGRASFNTVQGETGYYLFGKPEHLREMKRMGLVDYVSPGIHRLTEEGHEVYEKGRCV